MTRYYPLTYGREIHIVLQSMSTINSIIDDVAAAARADAEGCDPKAHATLLQNIQKLQLAAETPSETAKRLLYQVSSLHDGLTLLTQPSSQPPINIAIRVAVEFGLFEAVSAENGGSITAREMAESKNVDELLLGMLTPLRRRRGISANNVEFVLCVFLRPWVSATSPVLVYIHPTMSPVNSHREGLATASNACS